MLTEFFGLLQIINLNEMNATFNNFEFSEG